MSLSSTGGSGTGSSPVDEFVDGSRTLDSPLLLGHADVVQLITMKDAIGAIEQSCRQEHGGEAAAGKRQNLRFPGGWIRFMPAVMTGSGVFGYKEFHLIVTGEGKPEARVRYTTHLFDLTDGRQLASIDANHLTLLRTGAAAAIGTDRLAPAHAETAAVIGSGSEARAQLEALLAVRPVRAVRVFSPSEERRARFASETSRQLSVEIVPVASPREAVAGADVVVAATLTDGKPALLGEWLERGQHVTSIGSTMPTQRELDPEVWRRADAIVVDTLGLLGESGDALAAKEAGTIDLARIRTLSELVASGIAGRTNDEEITLYKSVGTSIHDLAIAEIVYLRAAAAGVGDRIVDVNSVKTVIPN